LLAMIDRLTRLQRRVEGEHGAIDARASAAVPEVGVHGVGKIERRGPLGQLDDGRVRREHVNGVVKQRLRSLFTALALDVALPRQQLAQHGDFGVVVGIGVHTLVAFAAGLFVGPVRRHPVLGVVVHGLGADLQLEGAALRVADHGVQRLVAVGFGLADVVIKLLGHRAVVGVRVGEHAVAVLDLRHHHAQRAQVEHLLEIEPLAAHFFDDAVDVLGAPLHLGGDALRAQRPLQVLAHLFDVALALDAFFVDAARDVFVGLWLEEAKGQVFDLPLDRPDP